MKLIDRELFGDFFRTFLALELLLLILFLAQFMIGRFDDILQAESNGWLWGFVLFLCRVPRFVVDSSVVAVAASILWNVTRRTRNNEILAYLAGGISPSRLAAPFLAGSCVVFCAIIALNEFLVADAAVAERYVERVQLKGRTEADLLRSTDIFQRGVDGRLYLISSYDGSTATLNEPTIVDVNRESRRPEWILNADSAVQVADGTREIWEFQNASIRTFDERGRLVSLRTHAIITEEDLERAIEPTLVQMITSLSNPDYMNSRELMRYIEMLNIQGKDSGQYIVALHTRFSLPLAIIIIAVLVCSHVMRPRAQGMIYSFGGGLVWIAAFYAVFVVCMRVGEESFGTIAPLILSWFPSLVFGVIGIVLLARLSR